MEFRTNLMPRFRRMANGDPMLMDSNAAKNVKKTTGWCEQPKNVHNKAVAAVRRGGGDVKNTQLIQGQYIIQFGRYQGQTFKWMLENCLGYAGYFIDDMVYRKEKETEAPLSVNKFKFKEYVLSFEEGRQAVEIKKEQRMKKTAVPPASSPSLSATTAMRTAAPAVLHQFLPPDEARKIRRQQATLIRPVVRPKLPARRQSSSDSTSSPASSPMKSDQMSDDQLLQEVINMESAETTGKTIRGTTTTPAPSETFPLKCSRSEVRSTVLLASTADLSTGPVVKDVPKPAVIATTADLTTLPTEPIAIDVIKTPTKASTETSDSMTAPVASYSSEKSTASSKRNIADVLKPAGPAYPMIDSWRKSLPSVDIQWVSAALFSLNASNKAELDDRKVNRLWYNPPQPAPLPNQRPRLDWYFGHRLFLWMPLRLWKMKLTCPTCKRGELTKAGPYRLTRLVLDVDDYYIMAGEYMKCAPCGKFFISWSKEILDLLDPATRSRFPVSVMYRTACDQRVIRQMQQRGLGNSPTQLQKQIVESHNRAWACRQLQYLSDCKFFLRLTENRLVSHQGSFDKPPTQNPVPNYQWFIYVYSQEVKERLEELKSSVTSVFGRVLKMDSTKKVTKKLAGAAARTAAWCTNISNEHGQVLQSVLTAAEGVGLESMSHGIVKRYQDAGVSPPEIIYVDGHCCGKSQLMDIFRSSWPEMDICLDIWHYMKRLAVGVSTDTHRLYGTFMSQLSHAIFEWDKDDLELLKKAKKVEMELAHILDPSQADIIRNIDRKELQLHCRRKTRGSEITISMIQMLIEMFDSEQGRDTMGVPLFHSERMWQVWNDQKRHVQCIQDPEDVQLYIQTGTLKKGGVTLPVYRCARGSTSLESFHLHLQRFIPGTSANANNFQNYLLEGITRWNEDRAREAVSGTPDSLCYDASLKNALNIVSQEILGEKVYPSFKPPNKYTGELIGVEYLYSQTGRVLENEEELDAADSDAATIDIDEGFEEEVEDLTANLVEAFMPTRMSVEKPDVSTARQKAKEIMQRNRPSRAHVQLLLSQDQPVDQSVGTASTAAATMTSTENTSATQTTSPDEAVGPGNIGGYERVIALAHYLYLLLAKQTKVITQSEAEEIISLWNRLSSYDRSPSKFSERFRDDLIKGRFKQPKTKKIEVVAGSQSSRRCSLAPHLGPATWPDSNRYQEALISKLCMANTSDTIKAGKREPRWKRVLSLYVQIQKMVQDCKTVNDGTRIQLPDINQRTLTAWFSARGKNNEKDLLKKGLPLQGAPTLAADPLPPPLQKPDTLTAGNTKQIQFVVLDNTSGQVTKSRRRLFPEQPVTSAPSRLSVILPTQQSQTPLFTATPLVQQDTVAASSVVPSQHCDEVEHDAKERLPYSTVHYRKRKVEMELAGHCKRQYVRKTEGKICKQCGADLKGEGHRQFYGNIFCPRTSQSTYEEWKAALVVKGYGKKKKNEYN